MSRALYHLSYGTADGDYRAVAARAFSFRFFRRCLAIATRFLLFNLSSYEQKPGMTRLRIGSRWLRRSDSNRRPSGYEPDELPLLHPAR